MIRKLAIVILVLGLAPAAWAQSLFETPKGFVVDKACSAYSSIKKKTGAVALTVGETYRATGLNKVGGSHAYIDVGSSKKWVALECGRLDGEVVGGGGTTPTESCLAFFDTEDNPVRVGFGGDADITPPPPVVEPFGRAVDLVCGAPGTATTRDAFKELMRSHPRCCRG